MTPFANSDDDGKTTICFATKEKKKFFSMLFSFIVCLSLAAPKSKHIFGFECVLGCFFVVRCDSHFASYYLCWCLCCTKCFCIYYSFHNDQKHLEKKRKKCIKTLHAAYCWVCCVHQNFNLPVRRIFLSFFSFAPLFGESSFCYFLMFICWWLPLASHRRRRRRKLLIYCYRLHP